MLVVKHQITGLIDRLSAFQRAARPSDLIERYQTRRKREEFEDFLDDVCDCRYTEDGGPILIDGSFDNPNYWLRLWVLRSAVGWDPATQSGVLGQARRKEQYRTLKKFGVQQIWELDGRVKISQKAIKAIREEACELFDGIGNDDRLLAVNLPGGIPASLLYDFILRHQRSATIKFSDPSYLELCQKYLRYCRVAEGIVNQLDPTTIIASHALSATGPLVWFGLLKGARVIVPFGANGVAWYWSLTDTKQIFDLQDRPTYEEINLLPDDKRKDLRELGKKIINRRLDGDVQEFGPRKAFRERHAFVDRISLCKKMSWKIEKPIVAVYISNWFDFPHTYGMRNFSNFLDWINSILEIARKTSHCNWLLKPHPCDKWYGGVTIEQLVDVENSGHIGIANDSWSGKYVLKAIDAVITCHGTIGLEATSMGVPVLVSDRGWYDTIGFVKTVRNRDDFINKIATSWWVDMDMRRNQDLANTFIGLYWGRPDWQEEFVYGSDVDQWENYGYAIDLFRNNPTALDCEKSTIREWYNSGHPHFHSFKMLNSERHVC